MTPEIEKAIAAQHYAYNRDFTTPPEAVHLVRPQRLRELLENERTWQPMNTAPTGRLGSNGMRTDPDYIEPPTLLLLLEGGEYDIGSYDPFYLEGYGDGANGDSCWVGKEGQLPVDPIGWMTIPPKPIKEAP